MLLASSGARAAELSAKLQAVLFSKILSYDRSLRAGAEKVILVYADEAAEAEELAQALRVVGVHVTTSKPAAMAAGLDSDTVVYFFPHASTSASREAVANAHALSVAGDLALAERGEVAVAVGIKGGKTQIVVNLRVAKLQGQEFSSDLLNLATIIR